MTFEDILIEQNTETKKTVQETLDEIKDMISSALSSVKKCIALGAITVSLMSMSTAPESLIIDNSATAVQIEILQPQPSVKISIATISETQIRLEENLAQLQNLENGWDGYNALKPTSAAIKLAFMLISLLDEDVLRTCALFPSNDAGIYLQGKLAKGRLSIYVNGEVMAYIVKGEESKLAATSKVTPTTINYLNQGLKMYV